MKTERHSKRTSSDTAIERIESGFVCHIRRELLWTDQTLRPTKFRRHRHNCQVRFPALVPIGSLVQRRSAARPFREKIPVRLRKYRPLERARAPFQLGVSRLLMSRKELGQFAEVLGGISEEKFVNCATWSTSSEPVQAKDPFEVGEEHFDLLPQLHRDQVLVGLRNAPGDLPRVLMFLAGDLAEICVRAAFAFDVQTCQTSFSPRERPVPLAESPRCGSE